MLGDLDILFGKFGVPEPASAVSHLYSGLVWSLFWSHLCQISVWFFLSAIFWILLILFRELWVEKHQKPTKTKWDIGTKLIGLVGYLLYFLR